MEILPQISATAMDILQTLVAIFQTLAVIALGMVVAHVLFTVRERFNPPETAYRLDVPEVDTEDDEE